MKDLVIDNSVFMSWAFTDEKNKKSRDLLKRVEKITVYVPSLWVYELTNVLFVAEKKGRIKKVDTISFLNFIKFLPINIENSSYDIVTKDALAISREHNITIYDASYIELAIRKNLPIASFDKELVNISKKIGIIVA